MSKSKELPPLVAAAAALDDELRALTELADETRRESLDSERSMARATKALSAYVEQQARIEQRLRALVEEIDRARVQQQESIETLVHAAHDVERRAKSRDGLLARFAALGESAGRVSALAAELSARKGEGAADNELLSRLGAIQLEMAGVVAEAEALARAAKDDTWPEIARQADGIRQQMLAAKNKLALVQRTLAARGPS
jgi:chromosome segregation ATPase